MWMCSSEFILYKARVIALLKSLFRECPALKVTKRDIVLKKARYILPSRSIFAFPMGRTKSSFIASSDISKLTPYKSSFSNTTTEGNKHLWTFGTKKSLDCSSLTKLSKFEDVWCTWIRVPDSSLKQTFCIFSRIWWENLVQQNI